MEALGTLGGTLLHPLRTVGEAARAPSPIRSPVLWLLLVAAATVDPVQTARALAFTTVAPAGGISQLAGLLIRSVLLEYLAVTVYGLVLGRLAAGRLRRAPVEAAVELTLVPYGAVLLLGNLLRRLGWDAALYFPPWHGASGPVLAARLVIGYGPSALLLAWLTWTVLRRRKEDRASPETEAS